MFGCFEPPATLVPELCGAGGAEIQLADAAEAKSFLEIVSEPKIFPYNYTYIFGLKQCLNIFARYFTSSHSQLVPV